MTSKTTANATLHPIPRIAAFAAVAYFPLYWTYLYLFVQLETEITHWLTLVLVPLGLLVLCGRSALPGPSARMLLAGVGLQRRMLGRGLGWAVLAGAALGSLQLLLSRQKAGIIELILNGKFFYAFPLAFLMMLATAATTEEFFFRGIFQNSLISLTRRKWLANVLAAVAFGLYHFPYAYLKESWPSHGDWQAALSEGVVFSAVLGLVFGFAYNRTDNLLVPIVMHAMMNACWAATMVA